MDSLTPEALAEGRRLQEEALPGPWRVPAYNEAEIRLRRAAFLSEPWVNLDIELGVYGAKQVTPCTVGDVPTAELVAWLRNNAPALLDAAERILIRWRKEPPLSEGPYWWRESQESRPIIRSVGEWPGGGFVVIDRYKSRHHDGVIDVTEVGGEWCGPITPEGSADAAERAEKAEAELARLKEERDGPYNGEHYHCGCPAKRSDKLKAFCDTHLKGLAREGGNAPV